MIFSSVLISWTCFFSSWMVFKIDSVCEDKLKQQSPSKSWQLCPWTKRRKLIAARFVKWRAWLIPCLGGGHHTPLPSFSPVSAKVGIHKGADPSTQKKGHACVSRMSFSGHFLGRSQHSTKAFYLFPLQHSISLFIILNFDKASQVPERVNTSFS